MELPKYSKVSEEAPGGVLFNVPAIVGFPKKGANLSEKDVNC